MGITGDVSFPENSGSGRAIVISLLDANRLPRHTTTPAEAAMLAVHVVEPGSKERPSIKLAVRYRG